MRVAILGAGAIGGTIAALLARGGHTIDVVARGENLAALQNNGLQLKGAWGPFTAEVTATERLTRAPQLAFVTTKVQDAEAVILANARFLAQLPVVIVQNGLQSLGTAERVLPASQIVGALALYAASYVAPGSVEVTTAGPTYLGTSGADSEPAAVVASRILAAVMPATITPNFVGAQWTKLIVNQINALPAITGMSAQDVISDRGLRLLLTQSMREAVHVGIAAGVSFASIQGLSNRALRLFVRLPPAAGQLLPQAMKWRMGATPNPGSTLQSIRHGALTEIDYLNGAIVEAGDRLGVVTPVNRMLVELVHEVETGSTFLTPAAVLSRYRDA